MHACANGMHLLYRRYVRPSASHVITLLNSNVFVGLFYVKLEWTYTVHHQQVVKFGDKSICPELTWIICSFYLFLCNRYTLVCYIIFLFYFWHVLGGKLHESSAFCLYHYVTCLLTICLIFLMCFIYPVCCFYSFLKMLC